MRMLSGSILFLLASLSLVLFSQAQRAQRSYTGYLDSSSSYVTVDVYCGGTDVISSTLFESTTSADSTSLDSIYYSSCASRLSNNIDELFTVVISDGNNIVAYKQVQNITVQESSFLGAASGSAGADFYPNTPKTIVLFPGFVYSSTSSGRISYNFTIAVIGSLCGDGNRDASIGEECEEFGIGCDDDTCTCRTSYYVDTVYQSNVDCMYSPSDYGTPSDGFGLWLGIFIPIFVVLIVLSVVMRVLFIRGVIACCGVRRPRTTVTTTTTVVEPVSSTTTTTTVQTQQYPQPQVTEVAYYPQPQQYPPQQQQHVIPPQQHVMQYPQQYPPQQPNVDGPVVPPTQYSQSVVPQQQYPPQPYPEQPSPYHYPGGNAPVQGGYVVYSPPPQDGAFQPPK